MAYPYIQFSISKFQWALSELPVYFNQYYRDAMVQRLSLLLDFIQEKMNSRSLQVQIPLALCWRFVAVGTSGSDHGWKCFKHHHSSTIPHTHTHAQPFQTNTHTHTHTHTHIHTQTELRFVVQVY